MTDRTQYPGGAVNLNMLGAGTAASARANVHALRRGVEMGGHLALMEPGTYTVDQQVVAASDVTIEVGAGVTLDASAMSVPCIIGTSVSNVRLTGDGKLKCAAASVPSFTSVTGLQIDLRIVDSDDAPVQPTITTSAPAQRTRYGVEPFRLLPLKMTINLGLFGDSQTNNGFYTTGTSPDGLTPSAYIIDGATENYFRSNGWQNWLGPLSMQQIQVVGSWARQTNGVLAAGTSPVGAPLSYQVTQGLASSVWSTVDAAVIMIGTNDLAYTLAAWKTELVRQIGRIDKPVILIAAPVRNDALATTDNDYGVPGWAWLLQARKICAEIAAASYGKVMFIDGYGAVNSPTTVPDVVAAGFIHSDNIHQQNAGSYTIAQRVVDCLLPGGPVGPFDMWPNNSSAADESALDQGFANPLFGTASGGTAGAGVTLGAGAVASGLTIAQFASGTIASGGATVAANAITGGRGNMQTMAITSSAAGDGMSVTTSSFHNAGTTFVSAGQYYWGQCLVRIRSGGIYPRSIQLRTIGFMNPTNYVGYLFPAPTTPTDDVAIPFTATKTMLLRTPKMVVPAGVTFTSLTMIFRATFAAAGDCTIDIGNLECRRFT